MYNAEKDGYEPDESGKAIKELCTTEEGFITIGRQGYEKCFEGNVLGNNCDIRNLYINIQPESSNTSKYIGLFGMVQDNKIKDLSVKGQIAASNKYVGGIVGYGNNYTRLVNISNCSSSVNIINKSGGYIGGIGGCVYGKIENCINIGEINIDIEQSSWGEVGGIIGNLCADGYEKQNEIMKGCVNKGNIIVRGRGIPQYARDTLCVGGITGYDNGSTIEDCINEGNVQGETEQQNIYLGGISGYNDNDSWTGCIATIRNCENKGMIKGKNINKDVYIAGISGYSEKNSVIENCENSATIEGETLAGTMYKNEIVGKTEE